MWIIKKENKFVSYLIIFISLFILFIFAFEQYKIVQLNLDKNSQLEVKIKEKEAKINENIEIKKRINDDKNLTKYTVNIKEDELINYIYNHISENNFSSENKIEIKSLSISESSKNELWFLETNLILSVKVSNDESMKNLLDFFVSENSKYKFFIDSFTYPNDWRMWSRI